MSENLDLRSFAGLALPNGFVLAEVTESSMEMVDPVGRPALAKTTIIGYAISVVLASESVEVEKSISIYHEILAGMTVGMNHPPLAVSDFRESDFEAAAVAAHQRFGFATPIKVISYPRDFGFQ